MRDGERAGWEQKRRRRRRRKAAAVVVWSLVLVWGVLTKITAEPRRSAAPDR